MLAVTIIMGNMDGIVSGQHWERIMSTQAANKLIKNEKKIMKRNTQ